MSKHHLLITRLYMYLLSISSFIESSLLDANINVFIIKVRFLTSGLKIIIAASKPIPSCIQVLPADPVPEAFSTIYLKTN